MAHEIFPSTFFRPGDARKDQWEPEDWKRLHDAIKRDPPHTDEDVKRYCGSITPENLVLSCKLANKPCFDPIPKADEPVGQTPDQRRGYYGEEISEDQSQTRGYWKRVPSIENCQCYTFHSNIRVRRSGSAPEAKLELVRVVFAICSRPKQILTLGGLDHMLPAYSHCPSTCPSNGLSAPSVRISSCL